MRSDELPDHILEAIVGVRNISSSCLGKVLKGKNGKNLCRWCRGKLEGRRSNWCSDECVNLFLKLRDLPYTILDRDLGRCQTCNCDVLRLEWMINGWFHRTTSEQEELRQEYPCWFKDKDSPPKYLKSYEVDHITPLHLGGVGTSDNMEIKCSPCHKKKTSKEATERAKERRNGRNTKR